jgi:hypothetical protein
MSSAEGPSPGVVGDEHKPPSGAAAAAAPEKSRIALSQAHRLANLASAAATTFLLGGVASVVLALFPLRLTDNQWQLGALANLVANGSWILIGLVLLHLASMLQPRNTLLSQRLKIWRRLAALAAAGFLLIAPMQVLLTWIGVDASRNTRERVISTSENQLKAYRDALEKAEGFADLNSRLRAIPRAPALPEQAAQIPYPVLKQRLLLQLRQTEVTFRQRVENARPGPNPWELWRQTIRSTIASLLLALGFASGAEGLFGQASLLDSFRLLLRKARTKQSKGSRLKWLRSQWQGLKQRLSLPKRSGIRPISRPRSKARRPPLVLKIPRQWQFWRKKKKKGSSRQRVRTSR